MAITEAPQGIQADRRHRARTLGGGHRDPDAVARNLKKALLGALDTVREVAIDHLLEQRYERLMTYGVVRVKTSTQSPRPTTCSGRLNDHLPARTLLGCVQRRPSIPVCCWNLWLLLEKLLPLSVIHVDHRLQPQSAAWAQHCHTVKSAPWGCPVISINGVDSTDR